MDDHNRRMIDLVRNWIIHGASQDAQDRCLTEEVVQCCNRVLPQYTNKKPEKLIFTKERELVHFQKPMAIDTE